MKSAKEKESIGWFSLLFSEFSMILFLFYALSVESGKHERRAQAIVRGSVSPLSSNIFDTNPIPIKEDPMQRQHTADDELHVEVHIDLCPNDVLHVKIGNICLHLCRQDFLQLAQAVQEAADQITSASATNGTMKESVH